MQYTYSITTGALLTLCTGGACLSLQQESSEFMLNTKMIEIFILK